MNSMRQEQLDYRETSNKKSDIGGFGLVGGGNGSTLPNDDLIITDELLTLLEDFQKKNYSAKEMEMLFESWKRKGNLQFHGKKNYYCIFFVKLKHYYFFANF